MMGIDYGLSAFPKSRRAGKACEQCGAPIRQKHRGRPVRFCSTRCAYQHRIDTNPKRLQPCQVCGKPFGENRTRFNARGKTCSAKCGYELRKRTLRPKRQCNHCDEWYYPIGANSNRTKYCSMKCFNAVRGRRIAWIFVKCMRCACLFRRTQAAVNRVKRSFCSNDCRNQFFVGENHQWFRGGSDPNRGSQWLKLAREIRNRDGHQCRRCGTTEADNKQRLSVDHVRPWRSFKDKADANHPDNLVALCRSCHTFKTVTVERAWLRGDVLAWRQWVQSLHLPSAARNA